MFQINIADSLKAMKTHSRTVYNLILILVATRITALRRKNGSSERSSSSGSLRFLTPVSLFFLHIISYLLFLILHWNSLHSLLLLPGSKISLHFINLLAKECNSYLTWEPVCLKADLCYSNSSNLQALFPHILCTWNKLHANSYLGINGEKKYLSRALFNIKLMK